MSFIVAHPGALVEYATKEEATKAADKFRKYKAVKVYEVREVGHCFPSGDKEGPRGPTTPGTPVEALVA